MMPAISENRRLTETSSHAPRSFAARPPRTPSPRPDRGDPGCEPTVGAGRPGDADPWPLDRARGRSGAATTPHGRSSGAVPPFLPEVTYEAGLRLSEILALHRFLADSSRTAPREVLRTVGLDVALRRRISSCSLGQARRVALACALLGQPRLLILDEPTSGMDVSARDRLFEHLRDFRRAGGTVLLSSHILAELDLVCDDFVLLNRGTVVRTGSLEAERRGERLRIVVRGLDMETVGVVLGPGWQLTRNETGVVAENEAGSTEVGTLVSGIERQGGSVDRVDRGRGLAEIYRQEMDQ